MTASFRDTEPRDRLIVALDVPTLDQARNLVETLGDTVSFYKVGYQLVYAGGLEFARELKEEGKKVFLDMKLLDIDNTIAKGVENIVKMGFDMLTIHAYPKAMAAAVDAAKGSSLCLLGVTVLTSMNDQDLRDAGYSDSAEELVLKRAGQAADAGMGGIVASAAEASKIRDIIGPDMALVTPGIRPKGADAGDQKRIVTPKNAISSGASHIVVGRPVVNSSLPIQSATDIYHDILAGS